MVHLLEWLRLADFALNTWRLARRAPMMLFLLPLPMFDLAGHSESTFAFHGVGFYEEHVAAGWSPGKAYGYAGAFSAFFDFAFYADLDTA